MATPHHGEPPQESLADRQERARLQRLFMDQINKTAKRAWPDGRTSHDDDGELAYAVATDLKHRVIRIQFSKPVEWLGLDQEAAEKLRDTLTERLHELRGITV